MKHDVTDILVAGAGLAGLIAAIGFAKQGWRVICVDPMLPAQKQHDPTADLRSTAYMQPARDFLERIGIWGEVTDEASALQTMRIVDISNPDHPIQRDFDAADISDAPFGWNVENWRMHRALMGLAGAFENLDLRFETKVNNITSRSHHAIITLSDETTVKAKLLIAADGRHSTVAKTLGIPHQRTDHGQVALSFMATHPIPHENISTEIHLRGGPFTFVPLRDHDGQACSAIVWMDTPENAKLRVALPPDEFAAAATQRSGGLFGPLTPITPPVPFPLITQIARSFTAPRTALIAEAAHVVPPIGAQGLNMSIADIECLCALTAAGGKDLGGPEMLAKYARNRLPDTKMRQSGIAFLNWASRSENPTVQNLRALGVSWLHDIPMLRKQVMRLGLGAK